ncbi:PcfB family protein (plasmid) [Oscillospiraceae bacterium PP1C4]
MQEETARGVIGIGVKTLKFTGEVLQQVIREYLKKFKTNYRGKMSLNQLTKQNGKLTSIDVNDKNIIQFNKIAKKYHVNYSVMKGQQDRHVVFFKANDVELMDAAFKEYASKKLEPEKPSIREKLKEFKEQSKGREPRGKVLDFNRHKEKAVEI